MRTCVRGRLALTAWLVGSCTHPLLASALPVTYSETLFNANGSLNGVAFPPDPQGPGFNCLALTLTFQSDTSNVVPFSVPKAAGFIDSVGNASFTELDPCQGKTLASGDFLPGQIFVSVDNTNRGIGFGSILGGSVYPAGVLIPTTDATLYDLQTAGTVTGFGLTSWQFGCVGTCGSSSDSPLPTTAGGLVLIGNLVSNASFSIDVTNAVPEPSSGALMLLGLVGIAAAAWRRDRRPAAC
jgi:hypothetical protein